MAEFQEKKLKENKVEWLTQYVQGILQMHTEANFVAFQLSNIFYVNFNDFINLIIPVLHFLSSRKIRRSPSNNR